MEYFSKNDNPIVPPPILTERKRQKKEQWLKNWSLTPPPDWDCQFCGWNNFGRNKTCNNRNAPNCAGMRPPREEWPSTIQNVPASLVGEDDLQARKALSQQTVGAEAWGTNDPIPPSWQQGVQMMGAAASTQQPSTSLLPFGRLPPNGNVQATVALCLGAFNDLVNSPAVGQSASDKVTSLMAEVNSVLAEDRSAKHSFAMQIAKHPWFEAMGLEVRYQPGKNQITVSASAQQWQDQNKKRPLEDDYLH
mmetsp:Transcript_4387/g.8859  ORF Transcript_4387/g.8859 Transcript_4387/m.8859 type:complete len:249 (+) Transcript_4387:3-749(+)